MQVTGCVRAMVSGWQVLGRAGDWHQSQRGGAWQCGAHLRQWEGRRVPISDLGAGESSRVFNCADDTATDSRRASARGAGDAPSAL